MASPEHIFHRSHIVFVPEDKTGSDASDQIGDENLPHLEEEQQAFQTVGLVVQSLGRGRKRVDLPIENIKKEYRSSVSVKELAKRHGVSRGTIYNRLHEVGLLEQAFNKKASSGPGVQTENPQQTLTPEGREPTWGERLSKDGFWVLDYLHIGHSKYIRERAEMEGINLDAGLKELRQQGLLDESNPEHPTVKLR